MEVDFLVLFFHISHLQKKFSRCISESLVSNGYSFSLFFLFVQIKAPGVKSIISKMSNSKADLLVENGDKIYFGDLFLEVRSVSGSISLR